MRRGGGGGTRGGVKGGCKIPLKREVCLICGCCSVYDGVSVLIFTRGARKTKKKGIYTSLTGQNILYNKTDSTYQTDTGRARVSHDTAFSISFHLPLVH